MATLERYLLTDEQKDLQAMVREFADKEIIPRAKEYDLSGEYPKDLVKQAVDMGLTRLSLPKKYGGEAIDNQTYAIVKEELARGDAGFSVTIGACYLGVMPVKLFGNDKQMQKVADCLNSGGLMAFGLTEAAAGSDSASLKTTYVKDGDSYILNGTKTFITNASVASLYTIFATKDPSLGAKGISAFIVEAGTPGLSAGKEEDKMGIRLSNTGEVVLQDVRVPAENLLGEEGQGFKIAMNTLNQTRPTSGAGAIGNAMFAYEYALQYAKERKTFGKPIGKHQAVGFMLADMAIQLEAARQMVNYAARLMDSGIVVPRVFSSAKAFGSDVCMKVVLDAVQIVGGYGYSREYPLEKRLRDAKIYQIFEGTNQIQRVIISGQILA
ncbi:MAG: acyl-CoA dehydrogenase family protein [Lachnospiraceae bacterium]|jgi:butyryl-CoA dehydrogenase|nr:acyl-CoA dehydrogenase family protein [Lachnospiraceae bacterium]